METMKALYKRFFDTRYHAPPGCPTQRDPPGYGLTVDKARRSLERERGARAASAISGKRPVQSCPLRVSRRRLAGSRRTIMRKPSSLISWIQSGPDGGRSAGEGRQGSMNADTRMPGF
jgi:hypothetical protein